MTLSTLGSLSRDDKFGWKNTFGVGDWMRDGAANRSGKSEIPMMSSLSCKRKSFLRYKTNRNFNCCLDGHDPSHRYRMFGENSSRLERGGSQQILSRCACLFVVFASAHHNCDLSTSSWRHPLHRGSRPCIVRMQQLAPQFSIFIREDEARRIDSKLGACNFIHQRCKALNHGPGLYRNENKQKRRQTVAQAVTSDEKMWKLRVDSGGMRNEKIVLASMKFFIGGFGSKEKLRVLREEKTKAAAFWVEKSGNLWPSKSSWSSLSWRQPTSPQKLIQVHNLQSPLKWRRNAIFSASISWAPERQLSRIP